MRSSDPYPGSHRYRLATFPGLVVVIASAAKAERAWPRRARKRPIVWRFEVERESAADCLPPYIEPRPGD
jgi:hypothetical protein